MAKNTTAKTEVKHYLLDKHLILAKWVFNHFGEGMTFSEITAGLDAPENEARDEDGHSTYLNLIINNCSLNERNAEFAEQLRTYDEHIIRITERINANRETDENDVIRWKYFQYFALLATEIYLDKYVKEPVSLMEELNALIKKYNAKHVKKGDQIKPIGEDENPFQVLNKIAYWIATGGGKTLIMHANILQYCDAMERAGKLDRLDNIILLTPNEDLSNQHLAEFQKSGIPAKLFDKNQTGPQYEGNLWNNIGVSKTVKIIDINKLKIAELDERQGSARGTGVTVAVESFEGNNLVIVDEGHSGASSKNESGWLERRKNLCADGFSFEYSATFAQIANGSLTSKDQQPIRDLYSRCILFDYSYRLFFEDGFGKDHYILNLSQDNESQGYNKWIYMVGCLLTFFQQLNYYVDMQKKRELDDFDIKKPLLVLVGHTVKGDKKQEVEKLQSDVVEIILFFKRFIENKDGESVEAINTILNKGFVDNNGMSYFAEKLGDAIADYYKMKGSAGNYADPDKIFAAMHQRVFNNETPVRSILKISKINSCEISLQVSGSEKPFGVVYVGDVGELTSILEKKEEFRETFTESRFQDSIFDTVNDEDSDVTVLVGARKFYLGWNCPRVATMGLLNVGKKEGTQIIQLFGRGIRLFGWNRSLKRSKWLRDKGIPVSAPSNMSVLETLNIFGVKSDYMKNFREYIEKEGIRTETWRFEINVSPTGIYNDAIVLDQLKQVDIEDTICGYPAKDGAAFKYASSILYLRKPTTDEEKEYLTKSGRVVLKRMAKIDVMDSTVTGEEKRRTDSGLEERHLSGYPDILEALDYDQLKENVERTKLEDGERRRQITNVIVTKANLRELLKDDSWYRLYVPRETLQWGHSYQKTVAVWQEIASDLLCRYLKRFYTCHKNNWEKKYYLYRPLSAKKENLRPDKDGNFKYTFTIDTTSQGTEEADLLRQQVNEIADLIKNKEEASQTADEKVGYEVNGNLVLLNVGPNHFYTPLVGQINEGKRGNRHSAITRIEPTPLNDGEVTFIKDLYAYIQTIPALLKDYNVYVLRNHERGAGIGFFNDGNFFPDFVLWLKHKTKNRQYVNFIDPKGLLKLAYDSPKLQFYKTIKEIQNSIKPKNEDEKGITLNSFIVSVSRSAEVVAAFNGGREPGDEEFSRERLENSNILFQYYTDNPAGCTYDYIVRMFCKILGEPYEQNLVETMVEFEKSFELGV